MSKHAFENGYLVSEGKIKEVRNKIFGGSSLDLEPKKEAPKPAFKTRPSYGYHKDGLKKAY